MYSTVGNNTNENIIKIISYDSCIYLRISLHNWISSIIQISVNPKFYSIDFDTTLERKNLAFRPIYKGYFRLPSADVSTRLDIAYCSSGTICLATAAINLALEGTSSIRGLSKLQILNLHNSGGITGLPATSDETHATRIIMIKLMCDVEIISFKAVILKYLLLVC